MGLRAYEYFMSNKHCPIGFNPIQKLSTNESLKQKINNSERIKHKTDKHKDFPLDPKLGRPTWFFIIFLLVLQHIYTCQSIHKTQSINPGLEHNRSSLDWIYKIPGVENHRTPKPCANSCTKPRVGSPMSGSTHQKKNCRGASLDPNKGDYHPPCDPPNIAPSATYRGGYRPFCYSPTHD